MIRFAEAVLPGHPDKFCDAVADAVVAEALHADAEAFAQIEVGIWSDRAWLSGCIVSREPLARSPTDVLIATGIALGLDGRNGIDARRYDVTDTVCLNHGDPTTERARCDDQCIVVGYAGYDARTRYLPPEQFLVHALRVALWHSCTSGPLKGCGPDGKLLAILREEGGRWTLERVLVTLQHPQAMGLLDLAVRVQETVGAAYTGVQANDPRWCAAWADVAVTVNPNGPYVAGGSDGDNGQTGRKLVMDYYGPRIPLGGGALSGKHPAHIDRLAAYAARHAAVHAVHTGAQECLIRLAYAPNGNAPLATVWEMSGRGERSARGYFDFDAMLARVEPATITAECGSGDHFWNEHLPWNRPGEE